MKEDESFDMKFLEFANDPEIADYFFELSSKALDYSIKQRELYIMENILLDENIINLDLNV